MTRRTADDKVLPDKASNIAKYPKYDWYQRGLASVVFKFFDKTWLVVVLKMRIFQTNNYLKNYRNQLLKYLRKEKYIHLLKTIFGVQI